MTIYHLAFLIIGMAIGTILGVGLMAIMICGRDADERVNRINKQ